MRLWLDDKRPMPTNFDTWAKTYKDAIKYLSTGNVQVISFDHDLDDFDENNSEKTGYDVAKWIEEKAFHNEIAPIEWTVHSDNPVGIVRIFMAMQNADKYWKKL